MPTKAQTRVCVQDGMLGGIDVVTRIARHVRRVYMLHTLFQVRQIKAKMN